MGINFKGFSMSPEAFRAWLDEMKVAKLARSDAECARLLDVAPKTIVKRKRNGADRETGLACRALLHRLEPYD